jgi:hypothetical protein
LYEVAGFVDRTLCVCVCVGEFGCV